MADGCCSENGRGCGRGQRHGGLNDTARTEWKLKTPPNCIPPHTSLFALTMRPSAFRSPKQHRLKQHGFRLLSVLFPLGKVTDSGVQSISTDRNTLPLRVMSNVDTPTNMSLASAGGCPPFNLNLLACKAAGSCCICARRKSLLLFQIIYYNTFSASSDGPCNFRALCQHAPR